MKKNLCFHAYNQQNLARYIMRRSHIFSNTCCDLNHHLFLMSTSETFAVSIALYFDVATMPSIFIGVLASQGIIPIRHTTVLFIDLIVSIRTVTCARTQAPAIIRPICFSCCLNLQATNRNFQKTYCKNHMFEN